MMYAAAFFLFSMIKTKVVNARRFFRLLVKVFKSKAGLTMSPKHLMFVALACLFYCASKIEISDESAADPTDDITLTNEELMASFKM